MTELLMALCAIDGVSGDEDQVRDYIKGHVSKLPVEMKTDVMGNLIVRKKGRRSAPDQLMICAHMDEVGLIVTQAADSGMLKFEFVGGVDRRVALGKQVLLGPNKVPGVIGLKAYHLVSRDEEKTVPKTEALYIDIGASDKDSALTQVPLGSYGAFRCQPEEFGQGLVKAKALDDRMGCAIMMTLLEEELPIDVTFVFTVQEEVGLRGAFGAAFSVRPQIALVLETTTAADLPTVEGQRRVCRVGGGPVISHMDGSAIYDRALFQALRSLADEHSIPWQVKEYISGGNDAGAIQRSRAGVRVAAISAPVRYLHAPASVGSLSDFEHCLKLTRLFIQHTAEGLLLGEK